MTTVALTRCNSYDYELVYERLKANLDLLGGIDAFVKPRDRVLLKVNLLSPKKPEEACTTHPAVAAAMIRLVKEAGGVPSIGDSSGGMAAGKSPTAQALKLSGIERVARELGAEVVNFDTLGTIEVDVPGGVTFKRLHLARPIVEADVVISLPKLKTHAMALYTGAIKNMYGSIPGVRKAQYHAQAPRLSDFAGGLVDIFAACKVKLNVMDGIVGMEGNGPSAGKPREIGLLLASTDAVALDAVASHIIGIDDPLKVETTRQAYERGVGEATLGKIEVLGESLADARVKGFKLPVSSRAANMPKWMGRFFLGQLTTHPQAGERCTGCGICAENCPVKAITVCDRRAVVAYDKCIGCLCCHELCPTHSMELRFNSPFADALIGRRKRREVARELDLLGEVASTNGPDNRSNS
jgi:uncharacterized protein (DUF362 family)/Pyruvate/2-oxoacid:ferredoxin oxidoreductase delta subunit